MQQESKEGKEILPPFPAIKLEKSRNGPFPSFLPSFLFFYFFPTAMLQNNPTLEFSTRVYFSLTRAAIPTRPRLILQISTYWPYSYSRCSKYCMYLSPPSSTSSPSFFFRDDFFPFLVSPVSTRPGPLFFFSSNRALPPPPPLP